MYKKMSLGVPKDGHFSCFQRSCLRWLSGSDYVTFVNVPENSITYDFSKLIVPGPMAIMHGKLACF